MTGRIALSSSIGILIISAFLLVPTKVSAESFIFQNDLSVGMTSDDVVMLQKILNRDPKTQVATAGPGSPGNETDYFGAMTRAAVVRFQQEYSTDILYPAALSYGTGYVGALTRNKLNALGSMTATPKPIQASGLAISSPSATSENSNNTRLIPSNPAALSPMKIVAAATSTDYLTDLDKKVIAGVTDKVNAQTAKIADPVKRKYIKDTIIAKLNASIREARLQAYLNSVGLRVMAYKDQANPENDKLSFSQPLPLSNIFSGAGKASSGFVAHAAEISQSTDRQILAQSDEMPFGGMYVMTIQCTCGDESLNYIMDYASMGVKALLYVPGESILWMNFNTYGTYQMGSYSFGGDCEIESGPDCTSINADGTYGMDPGTGTSFNHKSKYE